MSENLNDIFTNVSSDIPINGTASTSATDDGIVVEIVNSANSLRHSYVIYPELTMKEVIDACKVDLGLASSENQLIYEYNGETNSDMTATVKQVGIVSGAKLLVHPSGMVAAALVA